MKGITNVMSMAETGEGVVSDAWFRARVVTAMTSNRDDSAEAYEGPVRCGKAIFCMVLRTSVLEAAQVVGWRQGTGYSPRLLACASPCSFSVPLVLQHQGNFEGTISRALSRTTEPERLLIGLLDIIFLFIVSKNINSKHSM